MGDLKVAIVVAIIAGNIYFKSLPYYRLRIPVSAFK